MKRSTDRILTTHVGSLPRPDDLLELLLAQENGATSPMSPAFEARVRSAVGECVDQQHATGIDILNDGEWSKPDYSTYIKNRFTGFEGAVRRPWTSPRQARVPRLSRAYRARQRREPESCVRPATVPSPGGTSRPCSATSTTSRPSRGDCARSS